MAKDLFMLTLDQLRLTVKLMDLAALKSLYEKIILWKRKYADKVDDIKLADILRRETIVHRQLTLLGVTELKDFREWQHKLETKMTRTGRIN